MATRKKPEKTRLHSKRMAYLRGKLLEKRRELLLSLHRDVSHEHSGHPVPGDEYDAASESVDKEMHYAAAQNEAAQLGEVERALRRIEEGTYGNCERCGLKIPVARLEALPFATLCVKCKGEEERMNSMSVGPERLQGRTG